MEKALPLQHKNSKMTLFWYYIIAVNVLAFMVYGIDKAKARRHRWRVAEWVLLAFAVVGGSIGAILGMRCFNHKTKKPAFRFGVPAIILIQCGVVLYIMLS